MEQIIKNKGDLYQYTDGGVIHGYTKISTPECEPWVAWKGAKMPHAVWQQILAFFIWTFDETSKGSSSPDEAMVYLYYSEEHGKWLAWAPPQRGCGMTVKAVDEHPNWKQAEEFIGYAKVGSGHHHCKSSAFQSGTDSNDENPSEPGLHFTVGKLDCNMLDLHGRAVFKGNMISFSDGGVDGLLDWVEMADKYRKLKLPEELHYAAGYYSLKSRPGPEVTFPQTWRDNYLKFNWDGNHSNQNQGCGYHQNRGWKQKDPPTGYKPSDGYWSSVNGVDNWVPFQGVRPQNDTGQKKLLTLSAAGKAELELENLIENHGFTLIEMQLINDEMAMLSRGARNANSRMTSINDIMVRHGLNCRWLDKWIDDFTTYSNSEAWGGGA